MSARAAIVQGRRLAESLMLDQVTIDRVKGVETDPMTGKDTPIYERVYEGKGKVQSFAGYEAAKEVIAHSSVIQRMAVHIPVGSYRCSVGDVITLIESDVDPLLEGRQFRVTQEVPYKTFSTAYRIYVDFKAD